jgi:hypothetical protein
MDFLPERATNLMRLENLHELWNLSVGDAAQPPDQPDDLTQNALPGPQHGRYVSTRFGMPRSEQTSRPAGRLDAKRPPGRATQAICVNSIRDAAQPPDHQARRAGRLDAKRPPGPATRAICVNSLRDAAQPPDQRASQLTSRPTGRPCANARAQRDTAAAAHTKGRMPQHPPFCVS